ncbi:MAG: PEGA domain-containing protein, partial [Acidobacteriota bacterium]|nr:PEGA domain-containing protein [Acidobacteriota bacterium]
MRPVRTRAALALLPWVFTAFPSGTAAQETAMVDPVAIAGDLRALRPQTGDADLAVEAVLALTAILDQLDAARDPGGRLPQIENELFLRALEYRARAHVTRESPEQAADDLRLLILADPTWRLDVAGLSPAVLDLFEEQRSELLAYLTVLTEPAGVTVFVEEEPVGATPLTGRPVFAGLLTIRLERPGFTVYTEPRREVLAGEMITIEHEMVRSRPVLSVITSPAGVTVRVGGRVAGVTGGSLPEDLRPLVPPRFARDEFSAPLQLGNLETGANEITLEAPCRTPSRFTFHADEARDYLPRFVRLRPSTGGLRIESEPSGATVVLDGEERGVTPLSFSAMCSGEHEVEIRHPAGRCARSVTVSRGSRTAVSCEVLPVLAMTPS